MARETSDFTNSLVKFVGGFIIGGSVIGIMAHFARENLYNEIPFQQDVQEGYAIPSKLEIDLQDQDRNGKDETILKYGGQNYLLKLDEKGRPIIQAYEVRPVEIVPKE